MCSIHKWAIQPGETGADPECYCVQREDDSSLITLTGSLSFYYTCIKGFLFPFLPSWNIYRGICLTEKNTGIDPAVHVYSNVLHVAFKWPLTDHNLGYLKETTSWNAYRFGKLGNHVTQSVYVALVPRIHHAQVGGQAAGVARPGWAIVLWGDHKMDKDYETTLSGLT